MLPTHDRNVDPSVLKKVLEAAQRASSNDVIVFDLDSTLFDHRPRVVRIMREFGRAAHIPELENCQPKHMTDWSLAKTMILCGISKERAEALDPEARRFWNERFFTSEYCIEDVATEGATRFVQQILKTPVQIAYCTGRHTPMVEGTLRSFEREGFPLPDDRRIHLIVKPTFDISDDAFKKQVDTKLHSLGHVMALFDNEPSHINGYHQSFPDAIAVHLLTMDSGRGIPVAPGIPSIRNFVLPSL